MENNCTLFINNLIEHHTDDLNQILFTIMQRHIMYMYIELYKLTITYKIVPSKNDLYQVEF